MWPKKYITDEIEVFNIAHGGQTSSQVLFQLQTKSLPKEGIAFLQGNRSFQDVL